MGNIQLITSATEFDGVGIFHGCHAKLVENLSITLQSWQVKGLIPAYKLGDKWFYREDEINNAILKSKNSINLIK